MDILGGDFWQVRGAKDGPRMGEGVLNFLGGGNPIGSSVIFVLRIQIARSATVAALRNQLTTLRPNLRALSPTLCLDPLR